MTAPTRTQQSRLKKSSKSASRSAWVEHAMRKMTLRQKLGQMLMVPFFGRFTAFGSDEYREFLYQVEENQVGGLILVTSQGPLGIERSHLYATAIVINELQRRAEIPLVVGADFESGAGMRLVEGTSFPKAMAVAATGDPKFAYAVGRSTAVEARAAGVHWIFAPVADVNNNPENPIINIRSFGEDPRAVAEYVAAFVRGVEENGALATAKHFPGHGDVSVDSHLALATVSAGRDELADNALVPFRSAIRAGVSSIMPGHLAVPAIDPEPNMPATLSRTILTQVLRGELKFRGLIITDDLNMGGVTTLYPPGETAVRAVEAGADVLLMPPVPEAATAALEDAVESGRISMERIDTSVRRILEAKARLKLNSSRFADIERLHDVVGQPKIRAQAREIADRGATLLRDTPGLLPLDATRPLRILLVALSADPDSRPAAALENDIRPRVDSLAVLRADTRFVRVATLNPPSPESYDVAVVALFVRVADRKGHVSIPDDQRECVHRIIAAGKPAVVVGFGSPYLIARFPEAKTWLAQFSTDDASQRAVARAIFGQIGISGKIPVTVPGTVATSDGLGVAANPMTLKPASSAVARQLRPVCNLVDRAVADGAFPGGVLAVGWKNQLHVHPFGSLAREPKSPRVVTDTIYDVASLTKPVVTTTAVMMLGERRQIELDAPVSRYLPGFGATSKFDPDASWRARVTVRMLMHHDSGLPAHEDFFTQAKTEREIVARVMATPLVHEPGTQIEYSDLGFILVGKIVEVLTGQSLDHFAKQNIFEPLGMRSSLFKPPQNLRSRVAPTEIDAAFRKRLIRGEVHDENAWVMGGVAGHAGLFSTAGDIAAFAQMMLNGGIYSHHRLIARPTIQEFTAPTTLADSARALGWDVPVTPSSSGRYFGPRSYGHTGFTGVSLWIDPDQNLFVILLTNRVHPTRANNKIRQIRPPLHDAISERLGLTGSQTTAR